MKEEWRFVKHDGKELFCYRISSLGRVESIKPDGQSKILSKRIDTCGYEIVNLQIKGISRVKRIHRLVAEAFLGCRNSGWQVNHKDGVKSNNALSNLEWVTQKENMAHAHRHDLIGKRSAQLTAREQQAIEYLANETDANYLTIANAFGVSRRTVFNVLERQKKATKRRQAI